MSQKVHLDLGLVRALSAACAYRASELAARLAISPRHLRRLFIEQFGCAPERWLHNERLRVASAMLLSAESVKEVAFALCFRQESQFCRDFSARFGCTPSAWRKRVTVRDNEPAEISVQI